MIVPDTSVLLYAIGGEHPFRDPCARLVQAIGDDAMVATSTPEVIQEFTHVRSRRRSRGDAIQHARQSSRWLAPLTVVEPADLLEGLRLFGGVARIGAFDSVLAAVALRLKATLVSTDAGFSYVSGLDHVIPDNKGVDQLLGG